MADPKYVRLSERMARGNATDTRSHWGISGMDVKEFPEDPAAQTFVRAALRRGVLEEAGKAEYDEVQSTNEELAAVGATDEETQKALQRARQEIDVQRTSQRLGAKIEEARAVDGTDAFTSDQKRRKAVLKAQKAVESEDEAGEGLAEQEGGDSLKANAAAPGPDLVVGDSPVVAGGKVRRADAGKAQDNA